MKNDVVHLLATLSLPRFNAPPGGMRDFKLLSACHQVQTVTDLYALEFTLTPHPKFVTCQGCRESDVFRTLSMSWL